LKLETKRLILRQPEMKDAQSFTAIHNSAFVLRYNAMQPTTPERMEQAFTNPEYLENTVFLEEKETGNLLGAIFLEDDDLRYGVESKGLSYFIREDYARKGYMKEAMNAVIAALFEKEDLECICARAFAPNVASRALLKSLGFQENGIIPRCVKGYGDVIFDDVIHTLFQDDFHKE
jgi:ribosomal-protein-alanine N-acetyltransferase